MTFNCLASGGLRTDPAVGTRPSGFDRGIKVAEVTGVGLLLTASATYS